MMIPSHYYINVSLNGHHYCAVELGHTLNKEDALGRLATFRNKFTEEEGFRCDLTRVHCHGEPIA
jgi:hypothetical protein